MQADSQSYRFVFVPLYLCEFDRWSVFCRLCFGRRLWKWQFETISVCLTSNRLCKCVWQLRLTLIRKLDRNFQCFLFLSSRSSCFCSSARYIHGFLKLQDEDTFLVHIETVLTGTDPFSPQFQTPTSLLNLSKTWIFILKFKDVCLCKKLKSSRGTNS